MEKTNGTLEKIEIFQNNSFFLPNGSEHRVKNDNNLDLYWFISFLCPFYIISILRYEEQNFAHSASA